MSNWKFWSNGPGKDSSELTEQPARWLNNCSGKHKWGQFPLWAVVDICLSCLLFAFHMRESSVRTITCLCPPRAVCCTCQNGTFCVYVTKCDPSGEFQEHLSRARTLLVSLGCIQQCCGVDLGWMCVFRMSMWVPFVLARGWWRYQLFVALCFSITLMAVICLLGPYWRSLIFGGITVKSIKTTDQLCGRQGDRCFLSVFLPSFFSLVDISTTIRYGNPGIRMVLWRQEGISLALSLQLLSGVLGMLTHSHVQSVWLHKVTFPD